jgi:hypothetical protein
VNQRWVWSWSWLLRCIRSQPRRPSPVSVAVPHSLYFRNAGLPPGPTEIPLPYSLFTLATVCEPRAPGEGRAAASSQRPTSSSISRLSVPFPLLTLTYPPLPVLSVIRYVTDTSTTAPPRTLFLSLARIVRADSDSSLLSPRPTARPPSIRQTHTTSRPVALAQLVVVFSPSQLNTSLLHHGQGQARQAPGAGADW